MRHESAPGIYVSVTPPALVQKPQGSTSAALLGVSAARWPFFFFLFILTLGVKVSAFLTQLKNGVYICVKKFCDLCVWAKWPVAPTLNGIDPPLWVT